MIFINCLDFDISKLEAHKLALLTFRMKDSKGHRQSEEIHYELSEVHAFA